MKRYETVYLVVSTISEEEVTQVARKMETIVSQGQGVLIKHTPWGKKRLAYDVRTHGQRHDKGYYFHLDHLSSPEALSELERNLRIDERVLRFITVKLEDTPDVEKIVAKVKEEGPKEPLTIPKEVSPPEEAPPAEPSEGQETEA